MRADRLLYWQALFSYAFLLRIGSFLLDLISVILYIYYNHKNSNQNHHGKKKK